MRTIPSLMLLCAMTFTDTAALGSEVSPEFLDELSRRSHPPRYERVSLLNPWGEDLFVRQEITDGFGAQVLAAARVYAAQGIGYDGWLGSDRDGVHYRAAVDGKDVAYIADASVLGFREERDGVVDDPGERSWVCLDLALHAISLAGFPLRDAIVDDHAGAKEAYRGAGGVVIDRPGTSFFFRRVGNLHTYFKRRQHYVALRTTPAQIDDPDYRPVEPVRPGDLLFLGHHGDPPEKGGPWVPQHVAIAASVDARGLPVDVYNIRPSGGFRETYTGEIRQMRYLEGQGKHFARYCDRYSLVALGRVVHAHRPARNQ